MAKEATRHATLYREYRPKSFSEVRGQEHVVSTLQAAIKNGKISHAYLFAGSRGTGKTSIARIFAKSLQVSDKDLYEMDAASNRGIDEIRELREGVHAMPFESPYKFYILDEAHMLTKDAWNALLKTLEEPPAHCIFVLATTELQKVPDTIQSRCELYAFKQPSREVLSDTVAAVAKKEGYTLERSAAELVALLAEGSFRDALSILQKVLAVSKNKKIELSEVESVSGAPKGALVRACIEGVAQKDASKALAAVRKAAAGEIDMRTFAKLLIHRLRAILLMRHAAELAKELKDELSDEDWVLAESIAKDKDANMSADVLRKFLEAYAQIAYAAVPALPLELAIVEAVGV